MITGFWYPQGSANRQLAIFLVDSKNLFHVILAQPVSEQLPESLIEPVAQSSLQNSAFNPLLSDDTALKGNFHVVVISDRIGRIARRLILPDNSVFETMDNDSVDEYMKQYAHPAKSRQTFFKLENSVRMLIVSMLFLGLFGFSLKWIVPWAS